MLRHVPPTMKPPAVFLLFSRKRLHRAASSVVFNFSLCKTVVAWSPPPPPYWTSGCACCYRCWLRWGRVRTFVARGMPSRPSGMSTPQFASTKGSTEQNLTPWGPSPNSLTSTCRAAAKETVRPLSLSWEWP